MLFDDQGLKEADRKLRHRLSYEMGLTAAEKNSLTKMLAAWNKGWLSVVKQCQKKFNLLRRLQEADDDGFCICIATGERHHYTMIDAGHWIEAERNATRFDPGNVWPQSKHSNNHNHGDAGGREYTIGLSERFGFDFCRELMAKGRKTKSWKSSQKELLTMRIEWQRQIKIELERIEVAK